MSRIAETLWDLLRLKNRNGAAPIVEIPKKPPTPRRKIAPKQKSQATKPRTTPMQDRYDALVVEMKKAYGFRVRKWRSSMSGCAWEVMYHNGKVVRLLESPYPRGPMSCAIFLHEVGHHAIGFRTYRPRCLEEYHAWAWSLREMEARGLNVTESVKKRMADSLRYAIEKAHRRGLKKLPAELLPYMPENTVVQQ